MNYLLISATHLTSLVVPNNVAAKTAALVQYFYYLPRNFIASIHLRFQLEAMWNLGTFIAAWVARWFLSSPLRLSTPLLRTRPQCFISKLRLDSHPSKHSSKVNIQSTPINSLLYMPKAVIVGSTFQQTIFILKTKVMIQESHCVHIFNSPHDRHLVNKNCQIHRFPSLVISIQFCEKQAPFLGFFNLNPPRRGNIISSKWFLHWIRQEQFQRKHMNINICSINYAYFSRRPNSSEYHLLIFVQWTHIWIIYCIIKTSSVR